MNILDWVLLGWLLLAFLSGARFGLVYRIGHIVGLILGIYLAFSYGLTIAGWFGDGLYTKITVVLVLITAISALGGLVALIFDKFFRLFSWIPGLKSLNSILGGLLGLLTSAVTLSIVLAVANALPLPEQWALMIQQSLVGSWLAMFGSWVSNYIPYFNAYIS
jgi:uncharacterized membrane protein required for colicin V production